jgi:glycosyltransferase involved in cell wall biosynthesis
MKRIRVAHVITKLELGGAQNIALHTVEHLDPTLFEAHLVCGRGGMQDGRARALARAGVVRVRFITHLIRQIRPWTDCLGFLELLEAFLSIRPDIVHTHSSKAGVLGRAAAALCRMLTGSPRVIVHTVHGFGFHPRQAAVVRTLFETVEWACSRITDRLIFVSQANRNHAGALGIARPGRTELIRAGLPTAMFVGVTAQRARVRREMGIHEDAFVITTIGPFKPQKNHADFVRLAARLRDIAAVRGERPPLFLVAGDGILRPYIESLIRRSGVEDIVRLLGWHRNIPSLLGASDLLVMTSRWEGLPVAAVEALVAGLPVAAFRIDGLADIIENGVNGFLVTPGDVAALADAVHTIRTDRSFRERLQSASKTAMIEEFDIDRMVARTERLYRVLMHRLC